MRRALRTLSRADDVALADYGTPLGLLALRQLLARRMAEHGIEVSPDQIMLTESGTQAIDLICRFLIEPGDTVLVDDPCYFNFHALLRAHRAKVVSVPYTATGPDIDLFAEALAEHRPRLYITNSALHNPTGATLSPVVAHRVLKLADQHDLTIVEDDIFADFETTPAPRLAAFDGLERVIHIGSFSKTLSASVRCGFIAARPDWIEGLLDLKIATSFGGASLSAELVLALLMDGSYRKHMEALRQRLDRARSETVARLKAIGIVPWIEPQAGMFLWCQLPDGLDAADVARRGFGRERRACARQCLQPVADGRALHALQRRAVAGSADIHDASGGDEDRRPAHAVTLACSSRSATEKLSAQSPNLRPSMHLVTRQSSVSAAFMRSRAATKPAAQNDPSFTNRS